MAQIRARCRHSPVLCFAAFSVLVVAVATWSSGGAGTLFATVARQQVDLAQLKDAGFEQLKAIKRGLEAKLGSIRLPAPRIVMAFGKEQRLPSTVEDPEDPLPDTARYLSGHFAGSGSISSQKADLRVAESGPDTSNLFLFQQYFGGTVYVDRQGSGLHRTSIRWRVNGQKALRAALIMSKSKLSKRQQLLDMAEGRSHEKTLEAKEQVLFQHWSEVAGFLDACMRIRVEASARVRLKVQYPELATLKALQDFWSERLGIETSLGKNNDKQLVLSAGRETAGPILRAAIDSGLLLKKEPAEAVLSWTPETHFQVRKKVQEFVGNKDRFRRQDEEAVERSSQVLKLRAQIRRRQATGEDYEELQQQLSTLKSFHERAGLLEEIRRLQEHLIELERELGLAEEA